MGLVLVSGVLDSALELDLNLLLWSFCLDFGVPAFIKNTPNFMSL